MQRNSYISADKTGVMVEHAFVGAQNSMLWIQCMFRRKKSFLRRSNHQSIIVYITNYKCIHCKVHSGLGGCNNGMACLVHSAYFHKCAHYIYCNAACISAWGSVIMEWPAGGRGWLVVFLSTCISSHQTRSQWFLNDFCLFLLGSCADYKVCPHAFLLLINIFISKQFSLLSLKLQT